MYSTASKRGRRKYAGRSLIRKYLGRGWNWNVISHPRVNMSTWYGYNIRAYQTGMKAPLHLQRNPMNLLIYEFRGCVISYVSLLLLVSMYGRYFIIRLKSLHIYKSMMSNGKFVINNEIPLHYVVLILEDVACFKYSIWNKTGYENLCGWGWTINGNRLLKQTTII